MLDASADAEAGNQNGDDRDEDDQRQRHAPIDEIEQHNRADEIDDRRDDFPRQAAIDGPRRSAQRRDAIAQRTSEVLVEVAHRVAREVLEQIDPQIHHTGYNGPAPQPATQPPEHVFDHDQTKEQPEGQPHIGSGALAFGHGVDQHLHAVLHRHRATRRPGYQQKQASKMPGPLAYVMPQEGNGPVRQWNRGFGRVLDRLGHGVA